MMIQQSYRPTPDGWLAFEMNVLRRLKFSSVALPFTGEPDLCLALKRIGARVLANDSSLWSWTKSTAMIENDGSLLSDGDIEMVLEDAYVPRASLNNPTLLKWFGETDAWWFDNVRENALRLASVAVRARALTLAMMVGDYARSFDSTTRGLRLPLSVAFNRINTCLAPPIDNRLRSVASNRQPHEFIAESQYVDLMLLRLPPISRCLDSGKSSRTAWREEWLHGNDEFWSEFETKRAGRLGSQTASKQQYLYHIEDLLRAASHIPQWAITHIEDGFISANEIVESVTRVRKVETIFTKDFTELTGMRAVMITAR